MILLLGLPGDNRKGDFPVNEGKKIQEDLVSRSLVFRSLSIISELIGKVARNG